MARRIPPYSWCSKHPALSTPDTDTAGFPVTSRRGRARKVIRLVLEATNRVRLPAPSVLPIAGAVIGLYSGLAAGLFANLIQLVSGVVFGTPRLFELTHGTGGFWTGIRPGMAAARWHLEYAIIGVPLGLVGLLLSKWMRPGGARDQVRQRLRILALLTLGALSLYYPLLAVATLNELLGASQPLLQRLAALPVWMRILGPTLGGLAVGHLLRNSPQTQGHGLPEVMAAVKTPGDTLRTRGGALKMIGAAITIGSGGSAGREGPIVFVGAAFASGVARTLGFSRRELAILMASGAGAGIAASFNVPIAGAVFALEVILRELELTVFSPIILASVTATMVGRSVMGAAPMLQRVAYEMISGWEIIAYVGLGLLCGVLGYALIELLHRVENFVRGKTAHPISARLAQLPLSVRAGIGGFAVGLLGLINPAVWGTGHEAVNLAAAGEAGLLFLVSGCLLKLIGTSVTIGSGMTGGTLFPSLVIGGLAGGAFGTVVHAIAPSLSAPSGAYATVGMGSAVAALMRGPLTGMMMIYELSNSYAIILPLMVSCAIASALCHYLTERRHPPKAAQPHVLQDTRVRMVMSNAQPVQGDMPLRELVDRLLISNDKALAVLNGQGQVAGIAQLDRIGEVWLDSNLVQMLRAIDVISAVSTIGADVDLQSALDRMNQDDVDALPVVDGRGSVGVGLVTRTAIRRHVFRSNAPAPVSSEAPVAPTEVSQ